jgi:hypothetical protein
LTLPEPGVDGFILPEDRRLIVFKAPAAST